MRKLLFIIASVILSVSHVGADEERAPVPLVFTSDNGRHLFTIIPSKMNSKSGNRREAFGIAYELTDDGVFKKLYRIDGWYSFEIFVSNDGRSIIRMGPWNRGQRPHKDHLAIAFYRDGKFIKSYSTSDLVKSPEKVSASKSHYKWLKTTPEKPGYRGKFSLTTTDDRTYEFDEVTGEITSTENAEDC